MPGRTYVLIHSRKKVFDYIVAFKANNDGNSPTMREISHACGVKSTSNVEYILNQLEESGYIRRLSGARGIIVNGGQWQFQGAQNA